MQNVEKINRLLQDSNLRSQREVGFEATALGPLGQVVCFVKMLECHIFFLYNLLI